MDKYDGNTHKQCTKCGEVKEFGEFRHNQCITCVNKRRRETAKRNNPEKYKEDKKAARKRYYAKYPEKKRESKRGAERRRRIEANKTALFLALINTQRRQER